MYLSYKCRATHPQNFRFDLSVLWGSLAAVLSWWELLQSAKHPGTAMKFGLGTCFQYLNPLALRGMIPCKGVLGIFSFFLLLFVCCFCLT